MVDAIVPNFSATVGLECTRQRRLAYKRREHYATRICCEREPNTAVQ